MSADLNGDSLSLLVGAPNEFGRMRFDGLDLVAGFDTHANGDQPNERSASRQLLEQHKKDARADTDEEDEEEESAHLQRELSFDDLTRFALAGGGGSGGKVQQLQQAAAAVWQAARRWIDK